MATATSPPTATAAPGPREVKLYSHSPIFYWWPVWLVGYLMALLTYLDGGRLAVVPGGTEARRDWRVEVAPGRFETREGLILPAAVAGRPAHLAPAGEAQAGEPPPPAQPRVRMASSAFLGTWFFLAEVHAQLGEKDKAFQWLEQGYQNHDFFMTFLKTDPGVDPLRSDPRFAAMLKKIGVPEKSS